ncbi:hypothetical protein ES703_49733 [subsurface metagenome]
MKLEKAIKQLEDALADKWCPWSSELKQSIKLGIEAMKAVKYQRRISGIDNPTLLPGETEK